MNIVSMLLLDHRETPVPPSQMAAPLISINDCSPLDSNRTTISLRGGNISARAIRFIYYLKSPSENDPAKSRILSWEASFLKKMKELRSKMNWKGRKGRELYLSV